ncbi:hypothetical protein [Paenibacillus fonticola]|uniref:hypothetical protein n=1 Tax=Paenibacillus fonticola TaxID=379896 RepID=UPI00036B9219|nr:hypothetical protein [Paenibacillus fonticola]
MIKYKLILPSTFLAISLTACTFAPNSASQLPSSNQTVQSTAPQKILFKDENDGTSVKEQKRLNIYSVPDHILQNKVTEIPYYAFGEISFVTEEDINSVNEGHSPWKATPLLSAELLTTNLIPTNINKDQVSYVVTKQLNPNKANEITTVEMNIPGAGVYTITLQYPENSPISFITQITFVSENNSQ